ncbi:MAG: hypothetical protein RSJ40_10390, partial [Acetivibrio sp.]
MSYNENEVIPKEKFKFVQKDEMIHDTKLDTKPVGYLKDAFRRFSNNKGSIVCSIIILMLILYAVFVPIFAKVPPSEKDGYYSYLLPKSELLSKAGILTGCKDYELNQQSYDYYSAIPNALVKLKGKQTKLQAGREQVYYKAEVDTYAKVGYVNLRMTEEKYQKALQYQEKTGTQLFYPIIDQDKIASRSYKKDANAWYLTDPKGVAIKDANGDYQNIFLTSPESEDG